MVTSAPTIIGRVRACVNTAQDCKVSGCSDKKKKKKKKEREREKGENIKYVSTGIRLSIEVTTRKRQLNFHTTITLVPCTRDTVNRKRKQREEQERRRSLSCAS